MPNPEHEFGYDWDQNKWPTWDDLFYDIANEFNNDLSRWADDCAPNINMLPSADLRECPEVLRELASTIIVYVDSLDIIEEVDMTFCRAKSAWNEDDAYRRISVQAPEPVDPNQEVLPLDEQS